MKLIVTMASLAGLGLLFAMPSWLLAQPALPPAPQPQPTAAPPAAASNHATVGAFADYLRFTPSSGTANFVGLGGRVGLYLSRHASIEGEMNYDFARDYTSSSSSSTSGTVTTTFVTTRLRPLTGLFGPKLDLGSPSAHAFVTGKVGFVNFTYSNPNHVSTGTFSNSISGVGGPGTHVAFYPGGGLEGFWGFLGLRAEAGDEVYLANGAHGNLRATFGPAIRF
jgi:hypothetical protein